MMTCLWLASPQEYAAELLQALEAAREASDGAQRAAKREERRVEGALAEADAAAARQVLRERDEVPDNADRCCTSQAVLQLRVHYTGRA